MYGDKRTGAGRYRKDGDSWQPQAPMRKEKALHGGTRARTNERPYGGKNVESSRKPFMAPLGQGQGGIKGSSRVMGKHNSHGLLLLRNKRWVKVM